MIGRDFFDFRPLRQRRPALAAMPARGAGQPLDRPMEDDTLQQLLRKELAGQRVLIVDRHADARSALRMTLSALGIASVRNATTAREALRLAGASRFDLILADYLLDNGLDGQQLLEELRQQRLIPLASVFMIVTGERSYQSVVSVAELAPDDYLIKPFSADQLQSRLLRAMAKKRFLARIYAHLENDAFTDALAACTGLATEKSEFQLDALRLQGEILNALGRYDEAAAVYRQTLADHVAPWARMGLALALRGRGELAEATVLAQAVVNEFPQFLAAYDLLADLHERSGKLAAAQEVLLAAASRSPNNAGRQRHVGEVALRNKDLDAAEKAFGKVLERVRGTSLKRVDDFASLARVMLDKGNAAGARGLAGELRREWRGDRSGEFAALVVDSLAAEQAGETSQARQSLASALVQHDALQADGIGVPQSLAVDLARACLAAGDEVRANALLRRAAAEHHEDSVMIERIRGVFTRSGREQAGKALLAQLGEEIVELNNRGVLAARGGNLDASVSMLIEAAERVPNVQFLVNAAKAILSKLEQGGWDAALGARAVAYIRRAQEKDANSPRVVSARDLCQRVARKYGVLSQVSSGWRATEKARGS